MRGASITVGRACVVATQAFLSVKKGVNRTKKMVMVGKAGGRVMNHWRTF